MEQTQKKKNLRGLLTKKPFFRVLPGREEAGGGGELTDIGETRANTDRLRYYEVTQADFIRELNPSSHAINDSSVYINYRQSPEDGLYYQEDFPRYAFAYQQEILDDRLARLTGNDIQFDLAEEDDDDALWKIFSDFKAGWADKRMENAWHCAAKSSMSTGDTAFVGFLDKGVFGWKVFSYANGDVLYPHYDRRTGKLAVFARAYKEYDENGNVQNYVEAWDDIFYYRLVLNPEEGNTIGEEKEPVPVIDGFDTDGYVLEDKAPHGFESIPVAYHRRDDGPVWSPSQETIEHREAAFSRLAQNNHDFGLPILGLYGQGKKIKEIATKDMSYASKIFIIPADGKAEFIKKEDASNAYKTELDLLEEKIYSQSMVIKAPELKSGDTPAAAIKLLYSDAYNKAMLEAQEYDEFICKMVAIFKWGYGIESKNRLSFANTRISFYITPFLPVNDQEVTNNLALAVQNGFVSKQTASERFYFSTPQEWKRIQREKHDDSMHDLLLEEQRLDMQQENTVETQEQLSEIQTDQQVEVMEAQAEIDKGEEDDDDKAHKVVSRKGSVATGRGRGRPNKSGKQWDSSGNFEGRDGWTKWNQTH